MADQTKPVSGQGTAPASDSLATPTDTMTDAEAIRLMVRLMLEEKKEAMLEKQEKARAYAEKQRQRVINAEYVIKEKNNVQRICTHKKGGRGVKSPKVDYAVYFHTFTNGASYIRCQICGMKWRNQDTDEFLFRRGQKVPNHTGIGWAKAMQMMGESTNTASASEIKFATQPLETDVTKLE